MKFFFTVKFALDLGIKRTKIVSFSKKPFLLSLLVSIARQGKTDIGNRFRFFLALKRPYNK